MNFVSNTIHAHSIPFNENLRKKIANSYENEIIPFSIDPIIQVTIFLDCNQITVNFLIKNVFFTTIQVEIAIDYNI